ncbi:receptor-type tyrosine-protein phosphatase zeta-like isoform X2 [Halichondria panicea]|uniref:receptor-type tyrosine-protein phosphatase zeta-like isoform X2 n=1 Tax=Halichondria panicea TaxID=6063 RepID=UPI00312B3ABB
MIHCTLPSDPPPVLSLMTTATDPAFESSVNLTCMSDGNQTNFIWRKNDIEFTNDGPSNSVYTIPSVSATDGGVYECGVACQNTINIFSNKSTITTMPNIVQLLPVGGNSSVMEGEMITLSCKVEGWPVPEVMWLNLSSSVTASVSSMANYSIMSITQDQEGVYQCKATNIRGTVARNHSVSVSTGITSTAAGSDSSQTDKNANMDATTTGNILHLVQVPFILLLVLSCVLSVGVVVLLFLMGCLCCKRVKARRPSDEISLLPGSNGERREDEGEVGYGNLETAKPSTVTTAFKDDPPQSRTPPEHRTEKAKQTERRSSPKVGKKKKSKSPDKELLISLDSADEEERQQKRRSGSGKRSEVNETTPAVESPLSQDNSGDKVLPAEKEAVPSEEAVTGEGAVPGEESGVTMVWGDDSSQEDKKEWESIPVDDQSDEASRVTALTERAKKLGRTVSFVELLTRSHPLNAEQINDLVYNPEHYTKTHPLLDEYKSVPSNSAKLMDLLPQEKAKNRYRNVLPNAHSRVHLSDLGEPGSTYINANYIRGYDDRERAYIASQGPTFDTMSDFWRMVWEQEVSVVIMITGLIERGVNKCAQYWPEVKEENPTQYGRFAVKNNFDEKKSIGVISYLTLISEEGKEREIHHFWYTNWPDFGVPKETGSILALQQTVGDYCHDNDKPLLVHCSAGLGRTGTYIAIDMGISQFEKEGKVDPLKYICEMRQDRGGIIQTPEQYLFVHNTLADHMTATD